MITIQCKSGGSIEFGVNKDMIHGNKLYLHIDQSSNMYNGEGDAAIVLTVPECKEVLGNINEFIKVMEGKDYVYTAESVEKLISIPEVQAIIKELGLSF